MLNISNSEKANEIASNAKKGRYFDIYQSAYIMAKWKDKQFKEYLEKKKSEYGIDYSVNALELLDEIINELFRK